jgi:ribonuclease-3
VTQALPDVGHAFADSGLLLEALTHASWAHENGGADYERLEFLGDAVLQLCSTKLLVARFPEAREGQLSRLRSRLVSTGALARTSRDLGLGAHIRLGVGEEATGGRERPRVLAGALEAVLGAVFVDAGFEVALALVTRWLDDPLAELEAETGAHKDPRSLLQEHTQRLLGETPTYPVVACDGPPHEPTFVVEARVGDRVLGRGEGRSKREASRRAAEVALRAEEA